MAQADTVLTFTSLQKYTRKRQLYAKNGFYIAIDSTGKVTSSSEESCLNAVLQFLSVGPDLVAIWGLQAQKYLAVNNEGSLFTTQNERKECVFREFFGKNFYNLFRTCHSDTDGKGWYLSVDENGKVSAEKVSCSNEPRLHFIVKTLKDEGRNYEKENEAEEEAVSPQPKHEKKTMKDFNLPSSEILWLTHPRPFEYDGCLSEMTSSTPSPPSSSCISGSSASTGE